MGLYNFQSRFVPFILSGQKTHAIRSVRKHLDKPGDTLYLYCRLRTKKRNWEVESSWFLNRGAFDQDQGTVHMVFLTGG
jgi:hypothetical protein